MSRVHVFSAVYGGISRVKRPHLGVVGSILDKEMGKDLPRALGLFCDALGTSNFYL